MCQKYIIEIGQDDNFPFDGHKKHCEEVVVRQMITWANLEQQRIHLQKMRLLLSLSSPYLVRITRILQRKNKFMLVDYQYVPDCLLNTHKVVENSFLATAKDKLIELARILSEAAIKIELKIANVGISQQGELKVFIKHNFEVVSHAEKSNLKSDYQRQCQRLLDTYFDFRNSRRTSSQLSDYSIKLDRKIAAIQDKINKRKRRQLPHSPTRTTNNHKQGKLKPKRHNIVLQSINSKLSLMTSQSVGKITHSYIQLQKKPNPETNNQTKNHKFSFHDYTTSSYKLNESAKKEDSLTKRVSTALQKSKLTFEMYEKYFKRCTTE